MRDVDCVLCGHGFCILGKGPPEPGASPNAGTGPYRRGAPTTIGAGAGMATGPPGVSTVTRRKCGCADSVAISLSDAKAMSARVSASFACRSSRREKASAVKASVSARFLTRATLVAKCSSVPASGLPANSEQNSIHSRSLWIEMRNLPAVGGREESVGCDEGMR